MVRSERTLKKTGQSTLESRYYLSSIALKEHTPQQWLDRICGHWAGVEIRNHWKRDVFMGEDRSRSRNANLLANLALIRSALLSLLAEEPDGRSLPEMHEYLHSRPDRCLTMIKKL